MKTIDIANRSKYKTNIIFIIRVKKMVIISITKVVIISIKKIDLYKQTAFICWKQILISE